jgi:hypothetical protein
MATGVSDYLEDAWLDTLRNVSFAVASPYVSLHDGYPADTGANEIVGGSYARQAVTFNAASGGLMDNSGALNFTNMPSVTIYGVGVWDAASAGNALYTGMLGGARDAFTAADTGDVFTAPAHGLSDNDRVVLEAGFGGSLPTGVSEGTIYHVVSGTTDTFQVSTSQGGAAVVLTADGNGEVIFVDEKVVGAGSTFQIAAGDLDLRLD